MQIMGSYKGEPLFIENSKEIRDKILEKYPETLIWSPEKLWIEECGDDKLTLSTETKFKEFNI